MKLKFWLFFFAVFAASLICCGQSARADCPQCTPCAQDKSSADSAVCRSIPDPHIDSDGDGLTDYQECMLGTKPKQPDPDTDKDGLPDAWEIKYFGLCLSFDADDDPDKDGVANLAEYKSGCMRPDYCDTDRDGKTDGREDINRNGVVDKKETDPCGRAGIQSSATGDDGQRIGVRGTINIYYEYDELGRIRKITRGAQQ